MKKGWWRRATLHRFADGCGMKRRSKGEQEITRECTIASSPAPTCTDIIWVVLLYRTQTLLQETTMTSVHIFLYLVGSHRRYNKLALGHRGGPSQIIQDCNMLKQRRTSMEHIWFIVASKISTHWKTDKQKLMLKSDVTVKHIMCRCTDVWSLFNNLQNKSVCWNLHCSTIIMEPWRVLITSKAFGAFYGKFQADVRVFSASSEVLLSLLPKSLSWISGDDDDDDIPWLWRSARIILKYLLGSLSTNNIHLINMGFAFLLVSHVPGGRLQSHEPSTCYPQLWSEEHEDVCR